MGKRGKSQQKGKGNSKQNVQDEYFNEEDMDDEIDAFHKQRDVIPLDVNADVDESDEDNEQPVFDLEGTSEDEDEVDDTQLSGIVAKMARQQKFLREKFGGVEDDMHDVESEEEEEKKKAWGRGKNIYYNADNVDEPQSSDEDEDFAEEEAEVLRLQMERTKHLTMEDFGFEVACKDGSDREPTFEEIMVKGKPISKASIDKTLEDKTSTAYEEVKKDLSSLSREEQMDIVYSSAPELIGLLSELSLAIEQLEEVNPVLRKIKVMDSTANGSMHYLEVKQLLLLSYCQAITFYLLLKSEGHAVRDHPVIARLVEIKNLLDKMKDLDKHLPSSDTGTVAGLDNDQIALTSNSFSKDVKHSPVLDEVEGQAVPDGPVEVVKVDPMKGCDIKVEKHKRKNEQVGVQSMEMLKARAALEEKLKHKRVFSTIAAKPDGAQKHHKPVNGLLETFDDFDDDAVDMEGAGRGLSNGHANSLHPCKHPRLIVPSKFNKLKVVSGDDDLPKRDDIGERRRKHERQVLAGAGVKSDDDDDNGDLYMEENDENADSEDEFYKEVKQQRAAKIAAKEEKYSRPPTVASEPEPEVDGKRLINYQMEKNRGLTRPRKKLTKNPRKKYKLKHQKAVIRRTGQVRKIRKPSGPYAGEASGINAGISRSIRFNS